MDRLFAGIEHIAVSARDPQGLAEWYRRVLGFDLLVSIDNGPERPKTYIVGLGRSLPYLEIVPGDGRVPERDRPNAEPGLAHLAVLVHDFDRAAAHLQSHGAREEGAERAAPFGSRVRFYRDPESNLFHILWRPRLLAEEASASALA